MGKGENALLLLGGPKGPRGDSEEDDEMGGDFEELAGDVYDALKSGDKEAFIMALETAIDALR